MGQFPWTPLTMTAVHMTYMTLCKTLFAEMKANRGQIGVHVETTISAPMGEAFDALSRAAAER